MSYYKKIQRYYKVITDDLNALKTINKFNKQKIIKSKKEIKIAFIVQMPEIWDKIKPVFEEIKNRNIDTMLIIVPQYNFENKTIGCKYGKELDFFKNISDDYLLAFSEGEWTDIDFSQFTYVFYQRPYDSFLPNHLRSDVVFKKTRICYISYCFWVFSLEYAAGCYNRDFFNNVFLAFLETKEGRNYLNKSINFFDLFGFKRKKRHFLYYGYPQFQGINTLPQKSSYKEMRILWTPRWTNGFAGGSNFLNYKDKIFCLSDYCKRIVIRPHQLMFDNFVSKKLMTKDDVDEYIKMTKRHDIIFDSNAMIEDTFEETDLLITDISSIMIPYYLSGKPMIFCPSDEVEMCQTFKDLLPTMYVANNWEDVMNTVEQLKKKGDWMYEIRKEMIKSYFPNFLQTSEKIVDKLIELA